MGRYFPFRGVYFFARKSLVSRATVARVTRLHQQARVLPLFRTLGVARFFRVRGLTESDVFRARKSRFKVQQGDTSGRVTKGTSGAIFETQSAVLRNRNRPTKSPRLAIDTDGYEEAAGKLGISSSLRRRTRPTSCPRFCFVFFSCLLHRATASFSRWRDSG